MNTVINFLKANGFSMMEPKSYANDMCNVVINDDGTYTVANHRGDAIYSTDLNIYWLIGVLIFFGYIDHHRIKFNFK